MRPLIPASLILFALISNGSAAVKMPSIFSDHMVLQRDKPVPIWGQANPGEEVTVEFANQKKTTRANAVGRWNLTLDPMPANAEPQLLKIGSLSIQDVLVGEVWLASGQSNMEWEMQMKPDSKADIPNATHPNLRIIEIPKTVALSPQDNVPAFWSPCTPESVASFSAVGYYFGLKLHSEFNVPVGIIQSAWGGTRIEPWTSEAGFDEVPELKEFAADVQAKLPGSAAYRRKQEEHLAAVETWSKTARSALENKQAVPALPAQPATFNAGAGTPTALYNAMIHPLVPFAIRGAIWYQGESNHNEGFVYTDKKKALLASWRTAFQQPELPFYFVQIAPFQYGEEDPEILPQFWQAQRECLRIPHTGMAVISDIGEVPDIHPAHKKEVARRLSLWALAKTYGRSDVDPSGPLYASHAIEGNAIRVKFDNASAGLATRDGKPPSHFEIAGRDGLFQEGTATIEGDSVIVTSPKVYVRDSGIVHALLGVADFNALSGDPVVGLAGRASSLKTSSPLRPRTQ